jgi:protein-disulfide isomerase
MTDSSKRARRDHAREMAREMREKDRKRRVRNRLFIQGGVVLGLLAIVAIVVVVIVSSTRPAGPGPANMASDGIVLSGDGTTVSAVQSAGVNTGGEPTATDQSSLGDTVNVVTYVDYMCPYCGQFETAQGEQLTQWAKSGAITLEVHPISILDSASQGTKYSTRAANAAACVANYDPNSFLDVNAAFFANQPEESSEGLTDDELKDLISGAGVDDENVTKCIDDGEFKDWVGAASDRVLATRDGGDSKIPNSDQPVFQGTPFVTIDGTYQSDSSVIYDPTAFASAVQAAADAKGITVDLATE